MSDNIQENQEQQQEEVRNNSKEYNFRALEAKYERQLAEERRAREEMERQLQELNAKEDEEDTDYIDKKKLKREQAKFGQQLKQETKSDIQNAVQAALAQERQQNWLNNNSDFENVMQHAQKLYETDKELAETILAMPNNFDRQKLVYRSIKTLGLHQPKQKEPSIQEKVDANRRGPYYQPTGVGAGPYSQVGDFSTAGQKNAYEKMKQLQARVRL